jgi:endonuclease/exonuclease/phosphatase family metal-dependent hydrolase
VIARRSPAIAALQEVPPRAIPALVARTGMRALTVLTSPLVGPPGLRGWLGERNPNLWRTHEGNSNVLLVRRDWRIVPGSAFGFRLNASRAMRADVRAFAVPPAERMRWRLEQRRMVGATLESSDGRRVTVGNLHAHNARDPCVVAAELRRAVAFLLLAAGDLPIVLAGDLNARVGEQGYVETVAAGFVQPAPCDAAIDPTRVDHILERGLEVVCAPRPIPAAERTLSIVVAGRTIRVELSDHPAYAARLAWHTPPRLSRG